MNTQFTNPPCQEQSTCAQKGDILVCSFYDSLVDIHNTNFRFEFGVGKSQPMLIEDIVACSFYDSWVDLLNTGFRFEFGVVNSQPIVIGDIVHAHFMTVQ